MMHDWEAISKTRASCFIGVFKHSKTIKALGLRPRAFISFLVFGNPDETLALVFEILLLSCLLSLRQKESHCKTIPMKMLSGYRFIFMQIRLSFVWKVLYRLIFKTETQANSEVVYLIAKRREIGHISVAYFSTERLLCSLVLQICESDWFDHP